MTIEDFFVTIGDFFERLFRAIDDHAYRAIEDQADQCSDGSKRMTYEEATQDITKGAVCECANRSLNGINEARIGCDRILEISKVYENAIPAQKAGRIAEELHAATFNIDAASKGYTAIRASTGASNGLATATSDITIKNGKQFIDEVQVKYYKTPVETTFNVAHNKYDSMQRVVPSDQVNAVKQIAKNRGTDQLGIRNYEAVKNSASDKIQIDSIKSKPISRPETIELAQNPSSANSLVSKTAINTIKHTALIGGAVSGGVSAISNINAVINKNKSGKDAIIDTLKDTAGGAASSGIIGGLTVATESTLVRAGFQSVARSAAPVAIGLTLFDISKDLFKATNGEMSGTELAKNSLCNVAKGGSTWLGLEGGTAIGSFICPGIGTIVGGIIGGICGCLFGSRLFR